MKRLTFLALILLVAFVASGSTGPAFWGSSGGGSAPAAPASADYINIVTAGADPTGTVDSTAIFAANLGSHIFVPTGTYLVGHLVLTSNTTIECGSWDSIIKLPDNTGDLPNDFWMGNVYTGAAINNVTIKNCQFHGNKTVGNTKGSGLSPNGVNILIENNYVHDTAYACISLGRPSGAANMRVLNNWCDNAALAGNGWGGIGIEGGNNIIVQGNIITSTDHFSHYGIDVETNNSWTINGITVANNISIAGSINFIAAPTAAAITNVVFTGNYATAVGAEGAGPGCRLERITGPTTFVGNYCVGPNTTSPALNMVNTNSNVLISGNTFQWNGDSQVAYPSFAGITIKDTPSNIFISGNHFRATGRSAAGTPSCIVDLHTTAGIVTIGENEYIGCQPFRRQPTNLATSFIQTPTRTQYTGLAVPPVNFSEYSGVGDIKNVNPWSDTFNGHWTIGSGLTVTDAATTDPLGGSDGAHFVADATGNSHAASLVVTQATADNWWVMSFWIKATSGTAAVPVRLLGNTSANLAQATFTATTTWTRVELAGLSNGVDTTLTMFINEGGTSLDFSVWRVMLSPGQLAPPPLKTTGTALTLANTLLHAGDMLATSINKVGITAPATSATLTIADGKTLTVSASTTLRGTGTTTSSATPTINTDLIRYYSLTAQTADITSFTTNLSGTPEDGQTLWISITGTAARAITWGASFEASTIALPTTTVTTARLDVGFVWNPATNKWRCIAVG